MRLHKVFDPWLSEFWQYSWEIFQYTNHIVLYYHDNLILCPPVDSCMQGFFLETGACSRVPSGGGRQRKWGYSP